MTMTLAEKIQHQAFQNKMKERGYRFFEGHKTGIVNARWEYIDQHTQDAWQGWQAAMSSRIPDRYAPREELINRITAHLAGGGLFNPEQANHEAVTNLLLAIREELKNGR